MKRARFAALVLFLLALPLVAQTPGHSMFSPGSLEWTDGPPSLPKGAKMAILKGNPGTEGIFTIRLKLPAAYRIAPHWHPAFENITVLEGDFAMGLGETFDEGALHVMGAGAFATMAPGTRHFAASKEGTVIQLHGMGPWQIYYVDPSNDPRQPATASSQRGTASKGSS